MEPALQATPPESHALMESTLKGWEGLLAPFQGASGSSSLCPGVSQTTLHPRLLSFHASGVKHGGALRRAMALIQARDWSCDEEITQLLLLCPGCWSGWIETEPLPGGAEVRAAWSVLSPGSHRHVGAARVRLSA